MANHKNSFMIISAVVFGIIFVLILISNQLVSKQLPQEPEVKATVPLAPAVIAEEPSTKKAKYIPMATQVSEESVTPKAIAPSPQEVKKIHEIPLDDVILLQ